MTRASLARHGSHNVRAARLSAFSGLRELWFRRSLQNPRLKPPRGLRPTIVAEPRTGETSAAAPPRQHRQRRAAATTKYEKSVGWMDGEWEPASNPRTELLHGPPARPATTCRRCCERETVSEPLRGRVRWRRTTARPSAVCTQPVAALGQSRNSKRSPPNLFSEEYCVLKSTAWMRLCVTFEVSWPARASVVPRNLPNQWNYSSALASPL